MSPRAFALPALLTLLSFATSACAARAAAPRATAASPAPIVAVRLGEPVVADAENQWNLSITLVNLGTGGLYIDTLTLAIEDLDPGQTRAGRVTHPDLSRLVPRETSLSGGDSLAFLYRCVATSERARFTLALTAHASDGAPRVATLEFESRPGPLTASLPSRTLTVDGRAVETVFVPAEGAAGAAPGLLLVHGDAAHARLMIPTARRLAARGYAVMLVSLPGYGTSAGPADLGGPASVRAAAAALDALAREAGVDPKRLGAWGLSRGAGVVASLAAGRAGLRAVVAQSGTYDLWAVHRGATAPGIAAAIEAEAGRDSSGWRERSPLLRAGTIAAATLVLHGERDPEAPAAQAHAFVAALQAAGRTVEPGFVNGGHRLPQVATERTVLAFLERHLRGDAAPR